MNSLTGRRTVIATSPAAPLFRTFIHSRIRVEIMRRDNHSPPRAVSPTPSVAPSLPVLAVTLLSLFTLVRAHASIERKNTIEIAKRAQIKYRDPTFARHFALHFRSYAIRCVFRADRTMRSALLSRVYDHCQRLLDAPRSVYER